MRDVDARSVGRWEALLPDAVKQGTIPRIVHQTYHSEDLPPLLARATRELSQRNPDWEHRFYDDAAADKFVRENFDPAVYAQFLRIGESYGVVRADLFRYLVVYKAGGVYLDIKSSAEHPLSDIIVGSEGFIVSNWDNQPGEAHEGWGQHPELIDLPHGEFQQWHVIAAPGHPFLRRVIATALARVEAYRPWFDGVGWLGVIKLSGPIMYTRAIAPLLPHHRHVSVRSHSELGLIYSVAEADGHKSFFKSHYIENPRPIVRMPLYLEPFSRGYASLHAWVRARRGKRVSER